MNLHKHQLYLLEQHSESYEIWSAIIRINTGGRSLIMKLGPVPLFWSKCNLTRQPTMMNVMVPDQLLFPGIQQEKPRNSQTL